MKKYFDSVLGSDGSPLVGASVTVYLTGTETKPPIYSDDGVTLAANPITTDVRGMYAFYAANGVFDLKIEKSGYGTFTVTGVEFGNKDDGPAFRAFASVTTSIPTGTTGTLVALQTETSDTDGCFAANKFTPDVAGWYQIQGQVSFADAVMTAASITAGIAKNGETAASCVTVSSREANGGYNSVSVSDLVYLNGTTDYVCLVATQTQGTSRDVEASAAATYLSGHLAKAG